MNAYADQLTSLIDAAPVWVVYLVACGVVFLETAVMLVGLVVPSEGLLIAAGVIAAVGSVNIAVLVAGCAIAAVAGDMSGYLIGRTFGARIGATRLGRSMARRMIRARGDAAAPGDAVIAIAAARWIGFVRSVVPLIAGARRMPFARYLFATALGGITWTATVLLVSWAVGETLGADIALIVAAGVGLVAFGFLVFRRIRGRHTASGAGASRA